MQFEILHLDEQGPTTDSAARVDYIVMTVEVPKGSTGPLDVRVLGGAGDDDLSLFVTGGLSGMAKAFLLLDGGSGKDKGHGVASRHGDQR